MIKRSKSHIRREKERQTLRRFIQVFCQQKHEHDRQNGELCVECRKLLSYAEKRLDKCPIDPKPKCKDCTVHCYQNKYRKRIKEVMRYSGMHFVKRGRVDWLVRYFNQ